MAHSRLSLVLKVLRLHSLPRFLPKVLSILVTCGLVPTHRLLLGLRLVLLLQLAHSPRSLVQKALQLLSLPHLLPMSLRLVKKDFGLG